MDAGHGLLLNDLLILLGSSTLIATVFHYFKIPTIVGFILSGILIGPYGLGWVSSVPGAELLTEIGIIFLMFTIGLEFSFTRLKLLRKPFLGLGITQVVVTLVISAVIIRYVDRFNWGQAVFMGGLVSLSSTAIVLKLLQDSRDMEAPYGTTTVGILLAQDIAVIPMMLAVPLLALGGASVDEGLSGQTMMLWAGKLAGLAIGLFVVARWVIPWAFERVVKTRSRELFFFSVILLCFGVAALCEVIGLSLSFGAFLAGLMIADSIYGRQATADIVPLRDNFLGLFFASVGMLVDLQLVAENLHWVLLAVVSVMLIKSGVTYGFARMLRYPRSTAIVTALMVFQVGEFSFILAQTGSDLGVISDKDLQFFLAVSVVTMMMTPFVFRLAPRLALWKRRVDELGEVSEEGRPSTVSVFKDLREQDEVEGHTIIVGYGVAGRNLGKVMKSLAIPYQVVDQNYEVVQELKKLGEPMHYGDASRSEILEEVGLERARLVVIAASGKHMIRAIVMTVRQLRPDVHIIIRVQFARDAQELGDIDNADVVVAEYETAVELLVQSLSAYGVASDEIQTLMADTRKQLKGESLSDALRRRVDLPAWETLSSIRPLVIKEEYGAVGQSLGELELRTRSGAIAVAIFRENVGTAIPSGDFVLEVGDVLHVIGDRECYLRAKQALAGKNTVSEIVRL